MAPKFFGVDEMGRIIELAAAWIVLLIYTSVWVYALVNLFYLVWTAYAV